MSGRFRKLSPQRMRVGRPVSPQPEDVSSSYRGRQLESPPLDSGRDTRHRRYKLQSPSPKDVSERDYVVRREYAGERLGLAFDDVITETKITEVWPGPCEASGIRAGMVVTAVDGRPVTSIDTLQSGISTAGLVFTLTVEEPLAQSSHLASISQALSAVRYPASPVVSPTQGPLPLPLTAPPTLPTNPTSTDEISQLQLQLEAAAIQTRSAQSRMFLASEKENTLQDELAIELNRRLRAESEVTTLQSKICQLEEEIFHLKEFKPKPNANTEQLNHERLRRAQLEEELLILRNENTSLKQLRLASHSDRIGRDKERELINQLDDERSQWRATQRSLEGKLQDALARAEEADLLRREIEALTNSVKAGDPSGFSTHRSPARRHVSRTTESRLRYETPRDTYRTQLSKYQAPAYPSSPVTATTKKATEEYVMTNSPGRERRSPRLHDRMLLSYRVQEGQDVVPDISRRGVDMSSNDKDGGPKEKDATAAATDTEKDSGINVLDERLDLLARRAQDAIKTAEDRADTAKAEADEEYRKRNALEERVRELEKLARIGFGDNSQREKDLGEENSKLRQRERELEKKEREMEAERKRKEAELKRKERDLERERDAERRRTEAERERRDRENERKREKERREREEQEREGIEEAKKEEDMRLKDMLKRAEEVFAAVCERGGWKDKALLDKLPKVLNCGDNWKSLLKELESDNNKVNLGHWKGWFTYINDLNGIADAEKRLDWVSGQLGLTDGEDSPGSLYGGMTTRELVAEAKHTDRARVKGSGSENIYANWGNK